jgi:uncharacterized protein (DUF2384 family)
MSVAVYARTIESIEEKAALSHDDVARMVGTSPRSVYRWASGVTGPRARGRDRLLEVAAVVNELAHSLSPEAAHLWLHAPNPFLDFDRPLDVLARGDYRRVLAAIEAIRDGVFV